MVFYTSELLDRYGLKHGFFTRLGGVSSEPFDRLNFKRGVGDKEDNVKKNRRLASQAIGADPTRLIFARLAHGSKVKIVLRKSRARDIAGVDAIVTQLKQQPICLSVADCVPIIIFDPVLRVIGIIHVGWRGLVAGIVAESIRLLLQTYQGKPQDIVAALGPAIAAESYEVDQGVVQALSRQFLAPEDVITSSQGKTHCNLRLGAEIQLRREGITSIEHIDIDTAAHTEEFYSYRAEGETGRCGVVASL